jgi:hypothetical protein
MLLARTGRAVALVGLVTFAGGAAHAEPSAAELQRARETFAAAEKDERLGVWGAALEKLRRVEQVKVTPGVRFHIALCEENLGQPVAALEDYARAEKLARDENNREVLSALREPMAALRARIPHLIVLVPPDVDGLGVSLDGRVVTPGYYNAEIPVDPGSHVVEARASGRKPFKRTVVTPERDVTTVAVTLDPEPSPPPPSPPFPTASARTTPGSRPPDNGKEDATTSRSSTRGRGGAILATTGAVALAGLGIGAYLVAGTKESDARAQCATLVQHDCDDLRGPVRTWDALALGSWIAGGALAAVAIVLWVTPSRTSKPSRHLFLGPGTAGLAGTF